MIENQISKPYIEWDQTFNGVSLSLVLPTIEHVFNVICNDNYVFITAYNNMIRGTSFTLPLYAQIDPIYTTSQETSGFRLNLSLCKKRAFECWPRLLSIQCLAIDIIQPDSRPQCDKLDTIDFDKVISGQGNKSGLEM